MIYKKFENINLQKDGLYNRNTQKKKSGNYILISLLIFMIALSIFFLFSVKYLINRPIVLNTVINVEKGNNINILYENISKVDKLGFKLFLLSKNKKTINLYEGEYVFSGTYEKSEILQIFDKGPKQSITKVVILEGWNKFDINTYLKDVGIVTNNEYIELVDNVDLIDNLKDKYKFLEAMNPNLKSLEGFLYPNTYYLDINGDIINTLILKQLDSFDDNVWRKYSQSLLDFDGILDTNDIDTKIGPYGALIMASIVEKEEKANGNKSIVSGILLNKLAKENAIYADVSLCYGLELDWKSCTPSVIAKGVSDKNNIYNTRKVKGLPPTPIGNPSSMTIDKFINFEKTLDMYYLHDKEGNIHTSRNLSEHNYKKSKYLNY